MVLLSIIAVGMLSLSAITFRTGTLESAQVRARANARMALMIAIGELQKQMGPDQRISANSSILDQSTVTHSHWLGVWNSWKAGTGEASQHSTIEGITDEMAPTYLPNRSDYFRKWLVSLNEDEMSNIASPKKLSLSASPMPGPDDVAILLVAGGSLGKEPEKTPNYVVARILDIKDQDTSEITGRYGWWIGDESQKARLMDDSYLSTPPVSSADKIYRSAAPGSMGTKTISGLEKMTDDTQLAALPSMATLDLVKDVTGRPAQQNFHDATPFSFSILTDVREGGLKRDLSTILEQPILRTNSGSEYMLYEFNDSRFPHQGNPLDDRRANSRVPIQDLAAYYQMYDDEPTFSNQRREGVRYTSTARANAIQTRVADLDGGTRDKQRFLREYTAQYKQPVITKIQFLLAMTSEPITDADRLAIVNRFPTNPALHIRAADTHKLRLGLTPMVTMWNPNNLPMVMDSSQVFYMYTPPFAMQFCKYRDGGPTGTYLKWFNLSGSTYNGPSGGNSGGYEQFKLRIARQTLPRQTYVFEPGEVKVFSVPSTSGGQLNDASTGLVTFGQENTLNTVNSWDPYGLFRIYSSSPSGGSPIQAPEVYNFTTAGAPRGEMLVFGKDDRISLKIDTESPAESLRATSGIGADGRAVSKWLSLYGAGFHHFMIDEQYVNPWQNQEDAWRHNVMLSRHGGSSANLSLAEAAATFNRDLLLPGFPRGIAPIDFDSSTNATPGSQIIAAGDDNDVVTLMEFSLSKGCETGNAASGGFGGGRRITSRPFLHSPLSVPPFIDQNDKASLYNNGWDWTIGKINALEDSIVTAKPGTGNGYFGGGYSLENGSTHVIQREIPALPPISIASLSHAELGGFSLAYSKCMGDNPDTDTFASKFGDTQRLKRPIGVDYQRVTATGQGGLAPHVQQAIGNSYAHPNIPSDKASTTATRLFDLEEGPKDVPFVDHSYLANKALWDEFFFSSIAPQPSKVQLFGGSTRTAKAVADDFFKINGTTPSSPLPNRRIVPYGNNLDQAELDTLFTEANLYKDGLADKIAAHLMIEGALNINSTSVKSWKTFLSSLKGKPVAYLNGGITPQEAASEGTSINFGSLPNAAPVQSADITKSNSPEDQWKSGRELTDEEIEQLAVAIVKQVKLRGPFLSTSEFINRRLDASNVDFSLKGALQAALDDDAVSINASFRTSARKMDAETASITGFKFPDAAKGPIAYGSAPYVDQADILRHFSEQLTPRGDTFVIRTYGDALDPNGKVIARAWCQAVVQRLPDYVDSTDAPHKKPSEITATNVNFGRKLEVVSFRWLNATEV